ncbi:SMI1/KNR4 family protein [Arcicella sp. LKC2W]|uniref:SMI1/KNR4 family protein n=1 Tax=Arcicella sp. LKC2W TaxID=2984198 RepID=UPI002B20F737|nr:SMI1/KNR4 family protein [Arcicella sp. LKC2W]MEA5457739.1 SMI1/KNR4 family protein [Arcicella sp. LKC2W]
MKKIQDFFERYNTIKRTNIPRNAILQIENIIGFQIPNDYKFFIENYTVFENSVGQECLQLWGLEEVVDNNLQYEIFEYLPKILGIGTNLGGEFIAIEKLNEDTFRIVLSPLIDLDKQYHIKIGDSFTDFIERVEDGKEWFV